MAFLHSKGISHRDIKPDNILINLEGFGSEGEKDVPIKANEHLKICDFGSAKQLLRHNEALAEGANAKGSVAYISTRYYRAPELLFGNQFYGIEIDLWAAGCVLAELFIKSPLDQQPEKAAVQKYSSVTYTLFRGQRNEHQLALIIDLMGTPTRAELDVLNPSFGNVTLPERKPQDIKDLLCDDVPSEAVDLIRMLLRYSPKERITAEQALSHPFFTSPIETQPEVVKICQKIDLADKHKSRDNKQSKKRSRK